MFKDYDSISTNEYLRSGLKDAAPMPRAEEEAIVDIMLDETKSRPIRLLARDKLIRSHCRLVYKIAAQKAIASGRPIGDIYQAAMLGMILATMRYDRKYGVRFTSFAVWWILQQINMEIYVLNDLVHVPKYTKDKLRDTMSRGLLDTSRGDFKDLFMANAKVLSLEAQVHASEEEKFTYEDVIEADYRDLEKIYSRDEDEKLGAILKSALDPKDLAILKSVYLHGMTLADVGEKTGLSGERMRQKKNRAVLRAQSALRKVMQEKNFTYTNKSDEMSVQDIFG